MEKLWKHVVINLKKYDEHSHTGILGYVENPFNAVKPYHYRINGLSTMILSVVQNCHPEIFQPINVHYQDMTQINISFEVVHFIQNKDPILNKTVCKVQLSQVLALWVLPPLPSYKKNLQILNSFHFQNSDSNVTEYTQLCKTLVEKKTMLCYTSYRCFELSTPFGLEKNLMLNNTHKNQLKFVFITATNWRLYRMNYKKKSKQQNNLAQCLKKTQIMELFLWIDWLLWKKMILIKLC